jgi:hypothetical protein
MRGTVFLERDKNSARRPINGHEQIGPMFTIDGRQIFDIDVHEARFVRLERFHCRPRCRGLQGFQIGDAVATQAPVQARTRDTAGLRNSRVTASRSSKGKCRAVLRYTTIRSWAGDRVVCK